MVTVTRLDGLRREDYRNADGGRALWAACQSPVYLVVDEEGVNMADGRVRRLLGNYWLYVDDQDGFSVLTEEEVGYLLLEPEDA